MFDHTCSQDECYYANKDDSDWWRYEEFGIDWDYPLGKKKIQAVWAKPQHLFLLCSAAKYSATHQQFSLCPSADTICCAWVGEVRLTV